MSRKKPYIIRTKAEIEQYSAMTQAILNQEWGANTPANLALVSEYIDLMLSPEQRQAMVSAKNDDGFPLGADAKVIMKLHKIALAAIDKDQGNVNVGALT